MFYEAVFVALLTGPGVPSTPYLDAEGERVARSLPDDFHLYAAGRLRAMGLLGAGEVSVAELRRQGLEYERDYDVGLLNVVRGRRLGMLVTGDPLRPPQPNEDG